MIEEPEDSESEDEYKKILLENNARIRQMKKE